MPDSSLESHASELAGVFAHPMPVHFLREADEIYLTLAFADVAGRAASKPELSPIHVEVFDPAIGIADLSGVARVSLLELPKYLEFKRAELARIGTTRPLLWIRGCVDHLLAPESRAALRAIGNAIRGGPRPLRHHARLVVSGTDEIPPDLVGVAAALDLSRPRDSDLEKFVARLLKGFGVGLEAQVARALRGFEAATIARIVEEACVGAPDDLLHAVQTLRDRHIRKAGIVEVLAPRRKVSDVGGLKHLVQWITDRAFVVRHLDEAKQAKVDAPRGVLLAGLPGCGKSLAAEVAAQEFDVPLLRLDVGRLMGKYLGESERNLRDALATAEAAAPCVLWIDEIEKGLSGAGTDEGGGTSGRVLGHLLTWMQEGNRGVFVVATANDVDRLPPELLRRGRFDEMFVLDLPTGSERREIIAKCLERRARYLHEDLVLELAKTTEDYSGADIEALVGAAVEEAFGDHGAMLGRAHFHAVTAAGFKPHAAQWGARIKQMRDNLKAHGFRPAGAASDDGPHDALPRTRKLGELPLPARPLQPLLAPRPILVRWPVGGQPVTVHISLEGDRRIARLAVGERDVVPESAAMAEYSVTYDADGVSLHPGVPRPNYNAHEPGLTLPATNADLRFSMNGAATRVRYQTRRGRPFESDVKMVEPRWLALQVAEITVNRRAGVDAFRWHPLLLHVGGLLPGAGDLEVVVGADGSRARLVWGAERWLGYEVSKIADDPERVELLLTHPDSGSLLDSEPAFFDRAALKTTQITLVVHRSGLLRARWVIGIGQAFDTEIRLPRSLR